MAAVLWRTCPGAGDIGADLIERKRLALPKPHEGGSYFRPSGCLPPTDGGRRYTAGPGDCVPAVARAVCSWLTKTLPACSREAVPKPNDGADFLRPSGWSPNVERVVIFVRARHKKLKIATSELHEETARRALCVQVFEKPPSFGSYGLDAHVKLGAAHRAVAQPAVLP